MSTRWKILLAAALAVIIVAAVFAEDQDKKHESQLRTVRGTVTDKDDTPIPAGVVYLKNTKTLTVKTYIADDAGHYRFSGLDANVDYEIHAEHQGQYSSKRTISSFDSRKEIVIHLKVDKKKDGK